MHLLQKDDKQVCSNKARPITISLCWIFLASREHYEHILHIIYVDNINIRMTSHMSQSNSESNKWMYHSTLLKKVKKGKLHFLLQPQIPIIKSQLLKQP